MLRLALVEELRRLADGVVAARRSREKARRWHEGLGDRRGLDRRERPAAPRRGPAGRRPAVRRRSSSSCCSGCATSRPRRRRRGRRCSARSQEQDDSADEMLRIEHQREAADQLAIGNVITSMRLLSSIDWTLFFERVSLVEQLLRGDPAGAYALMDFSDARSLPPLDRAARQARAAGRDRRRRASAIELARMARRDEPLHDRRHHVGYYLISRGRFRLEHDLGYKPRLRERLARFAFRHPAVGYLGAIAATTLLSVASLLVYAARRGATDAELLARRARRAAPGQRARHQPAPPDHHGARAAAPAAEARHARRHPRRNTGRSWWFRRSSTPSRGCSPCSTIWRCASWPTATRTSTSRSSATSRTPIGHRSTARPWFSTRAKRRIDELNERHGDRPLLLLSPRAPLESRRGAMDGMGAQARQAHGVQPAAPRRDRHQLRPSATATCRCCPSVKYVITLDSDTQLPMEAGRRLVGTLAHPLNRPRFDATVGRVTEGYGVLQPRVGVNVVSANRTAFAKVFSGHVGVDPYTTAVSDVYQDLFHEGSYVGKGIYDVDAFDAALANRVPENALLSHDLFEGFYARTGLCTDIHLVDDYPSHYLAFAARQHRWVRGDWQIVRWLWRTVPDASAPPGPEHAAGDRALEDPRQPAAQPAVAGAGGAPRRGLDGPARFRAAVDRAGAAGPRLPRLRPGGAVALEPRARRAAARARAGGARQPRDERAPVAPVGDLAGAPELVDGRRDRPNALAPARERPPPARVGLGRSDRAAGSVARPGHPPDVGRSGHRDWHRRAGRDDRSETPAAGASLDRALAALSGDRVRHREAAGPRASTARRGGTRDAAEDRAQDLAVLRRPPGPGRSLARSRQLPGRSRRARRAPHLADQHRAAAARDARRVRLRVPQLLGRRRSARADVRDAARAAALSRAFLQLVRHADAGAARAGLCLDGGQRQSRRLPPDAEERSLRNHR